LSCFLTTTLSRSVLTSEEHVGASLPLSPLLIRSSSPHVPLVFPLAVEWISVRFFLFLFSFFFLHLVFPCRPSLLHLEDGQAVSPGEYEVYMMFKGTFFVLPLPDLCWCPLLFLGVRLAYNFEFRGLTHDGVDLYPPVPSRFPPTLLGAVRFPFP